MEMVSGSQAIPPALGLLVALPTRQVDKTKLPIGHCPGWCGPHVEDYSPFWGSLLRAEPLESCF